MKFIFLAVIIIFLGLSAGYYFGFDHGFEKSANIKNESSVAETEVVNFVPEIPKEVKNGSCFTNSITVNSPKAWRCTVGNEIYDPCLLASDGKTLVCGANPSSGDKGFVLVLTEPLPSPEPMQKNNPNTWMVELPSGKICSFATGATGLIDSERINYFCENDDEKVTIALYGDLKRGKVWTANLAEFTQGDFKDGKITPEKKEVTPLQKAWVYE